MSATAPIILDDDTDRPFTIPACADTDQAALLRWAHDHPIDKPRRSSNRRTSTPSWRS